MHLRHLMTTDDVAAKMGVGRAAVAYWCRKGLIFPIVKIGTTWLIEPGFCLMKTATRSGRKKGSRNKKPYPIGVKRPRRRVVVSDGA